MRRLVGLGMGCLAMGVAVWGVLAEETRESKEMNWMKKTLPMEGEIFSLQGHAAFVIPPAPQAPMAAGKDAAHALPWVWYAPTLHDLPGETEKWMFEKFTNAGMAIAGVNVGESYGNLDGRALFTALYEELTRKRGFSKKACLLARSRGGLMHYNWAVENPSLVACIAGIYPVCDFRSYPGLKQACGAYHMTESELAAKLVDHNPIDRVESLAKARVPIFHIHGDSDKTVPLDKNSGALAERYRGFGGEMRLKVIEGRGHDWWSGWFQCQELVDFVIAHADKGEVPAKPDEAKKDATKEE